MHLGENKWPGILIRILIMIFPMKTLWWLWIGDFLGGPSWCAFRLFMHLLMYALTTKILYQHGPRMYYGQIVALIFTDVWESKVKEQEQFNLYLSLLITNKTVWNTYCVFKIEPHKPATNWPETARLYHCCHIDWNNCFTGIQELHYLKSNL